MVIVDLVGFGIVMPVLPFYAEQYGASGTTLGFLLTSYAAGQFVFAPLWGRLSDRFGRRPVLLSTVAGTGLSLLALGLADSLAGIFTARLLGGVFAANVSVAAAYISDVTRPDERTRWMGLLGASFGIGFVLGPAIGGALAPYGYSVPLLVAAGLAGANWVQAVLVLREPTRLAPDAASASRLDVLRAGAVRRLCLANLAFSLAVTQLETVFAYFMLHRFHYDARQVAFLMVAMALVMGGVQGGGMRALSRRFRERRLTRAGCLVLGVSLAGVPLAPSVGVLLVPLLAAALGRAVIQPSLLSLTSGAAPAAQRGAALGVFQASASLARVLGPVAAGWLYDREAAAPFYLAAGLLLVLALAGRGLPERPAEDALVASPGGETV